jgi:hypothetical protein
MIVTNLVKVPLRSKTTAMKSIFIIVPVMAIVGAAVTVTIPQIVKADTDCSQPLTQQDRYYCGYNAGSQQAQDCENHHTSSYCAGFDAGYAASWSASQRTPQPQNLSTTQPTPPQPQNLSTTQPTPPQPQNLSTTQPYVNPGTNIGSNNTQPSTPAPSSPPQPQPQQCGLGQTIGNDGQCHLSLTGALKACRDHPTACSIIQGLLLHSLGL